MALACSTHVKQKKNAIIGIVKWFEANITKCKNCPAELGQLYTCTDIYYTIIFSKKMFVSYLQALYLSTKI